MTHQIQDGASEPLVVGQGIAELYVSSLVKGWAANTQDTKAAVGVNGRGRDAQTCPPVYFGWHHLGRGLCESRWREEEVLMEKACWSLGPARAGLRPSYQDIRAGDWVAHGETIPSSFVS